MSNVTKRRAGKARTDYKLGALIQTERKAGLCTPHLSEAPGDKPLEPRQHQREAQDSDVGFYMEWRLFRM